MMFPATPQRTARTRCALPTPMIDPVIVCVVETGMPRFVARNSEMAPPVSAAKPPTGFSLVLDGLDLRDVRVAPAVVGIIPEHLDECCRAVDDERGVLVEEREKPALLRHEHGQEAHRDLPRRDRSPARIVRTEAASYGIVSP